MSKKVSSHVLSVDGKFFIGAGKIMYDWYSDEYNIPHLHFLVLKLETGLYEAVNLELSLFALGNDEENAVAELVELIMAHIDAVVKYGRGFAELHETAISHLMDNYWAEYRNIEFSAASQKQDIGHDVEQRFSNTIRNIITEKYEAKLIKLAEEKAEEFLDEIKNSIKRIKKYSFNILYQKVA